MLRINNNKIYFKQSKSEDKTENKSLLPKVPKMSEINFPVLASTAVGTGAALLFLAKYQRKGIREFAKIDYQLKEVLGIGAGSMAGGLIGGLIMDRGKQIRKKLEEANFQFLNNLLLPTVFAERSINFIEHSNIEVLQNLRTHHKATILVKSVATLLSIVGGMHLGGFIANKINNFALNNNKEEKFNRKIQFKDYAVHVDDIPVVLAVQNIQVINKIVPACFLTCGYEVGTKH